MKMSGGQAIAESLVRFGVGPMFGMGGFQLLPFYDAARRLGIKHYLINDERTGAFAADAYARISGRPGLMDATLGPGATNLVTGLTESLNAGVAVIALVGDSARQHSWKNMTQECRQTDILRPAVKELIRVETPGRIPELVARAFAVATSGRAGPVVLDIPEDVAHAEWEYSAADFEFDLSTAQFPSRRCRPAGDAVDQAVEMLAAAKRPLILAGGGVHLSQAHEALLAFVEALSIPVATTMSGKGSISETHALSAGVFGRYTRVANDLLEQSDCLLVLGCKLGEIATKRFALLRPGSPIIHLDILAEEFGRTTRPRLALWADVREGLTDLMAGLAGDAASLRAERIPHVAELQALRRAWLETAQDRLTSAERPINMGRLMAALNATMPERSVLVADGGFAAHWTSLLYDTKVAGRAYVANRGMASIGYGLPGAIGCKLADPDAVIVGLTGDGGLNMTIGELETARRVGAPVVMIVVNNAASGYIKALQHAMYGAGAYQSSDLVEMDYAAIARSFGCHGERVEDPDELVGAIRRAFLVTDRPSLLDVVVTRDPAKMLPAADSRTLKVEGGDRPI